MRIHELLQESFDSYYELDVITPTSYMFTTEDGKDYNIQIHPVSDIEEEWEGDIPDVNGPLRGYVFNFYLVDGDKGPLTKKSFDSPDNDSSTSKQKMKIFSTVMMLIKHSLTSQGMDFATFSGYRGLGSLYNRMIQRHLTDEFRVFSREMSSEETEFLVIRDDSLAY